MKLTKTSIKIPFEQAKAGQWIEWEDCGITCLGVMILDDGLYLYSILHEDFVNLEGDVIVTPVTIEEIKYGLGKTNHV